MSRPLLPVLLLLSACAGGGETDTLLAVKGLVSDDLDQLVLAAQALQTAAPTPDADGWQGGDELDASKAAWKEAHGAYERIEGAIAVLFPDLDASTDERYDGFLGEGPDDDLFDGEGVTGVHAVERILWADAHPAEVIAFESALTGYVEARFPANEAEATSYRDALVGRLITDCETMASDFEPLALDVAAAYEGVVGSMAEQVEKISLGATGEAESRYAQHTLADMRENLDGGRAIYEAFSPWIVAQPDGAAVDAEVLDGFDRLAAAYDALTGEALPDVPATWDPTDPSDADLATPYGTLWSLLTAESDPETEGSLVHEMVHAAEAIGLEIVP